MVRNETNPCPFTDELFPTKGYKITFKVSRYPEKTFGERLRKYRLGKGLRQKDLAKRLEVSEMAIVDWERERREPCKRYRERIERVF